MTSPLTANARLVSAAKVVNVIGRAIDPNVMQWIAGMVFGLAIQAQNAHAATDESALLALGRDDQDANTDNAVLEEMDQALSIDETDRVAVTVKHGSHTDQFLRHLATMPISEAMETLAKLKEHFANWYRDHPQAEVVADGSGESSQSQDVSDQAITQAVEQASLKFTGSASLGVSKLATSGTDSSDGAAGSVAFADIQLQFANEGQGSSDLNNQFASIDLGQDGGDSDTYNIPLACLRCSSLSLLLLMSSPFLSF